MSATALRRDDGSLNLELALMLMFLALIVVFALTMLGGAIGLKFDAARDFLMGGGGGSGPVVGSDAPPVTTVFWVAPDTAAAQSDIPSKIWNITGTWEDSWGWAAYDPDIETDPLGIKGEVVRAGDAAGSGSWGWLAFSRKPLVLVQGQKYRLHYDVLYRTTSGWPGDGSNDDPWAARFFFNPYNLDAGAYTYDVESGPFFRMGQTALHEGWNTYDIDFTFDMDITNADKGGNTPGRLPDGTAMSGLVDFENSGTDWAADPLGNSHVYLDNVYIVQLDGSGNPIEPTGGTPVTSPDPNPSVTPPPPPPPPTPIGTMFVAGGVTEAGGDCIATSADNGVTWTVRGGGLWATVQDVKWNGSMWLATGLGLGPAGVEGEDTFLTSTDGLTWTPRGGGTPLLGAGQAVAWGNSTWVAVGSKVWNKTDTVLTSPDGITWTGRGTVLTTCYGVVWTGTNFVAVGRGTTNNVATSPDGITWTGRGLATVPEPSTFVPEVNAVTWNGTRLLAMSDKGIATSDDHGLTWTIRSSSGEIAFDDAAWNGTVWVAAGKSQDNANWLFTSPDGITWTGRGKGGLGEYPGDVAWNGGVFTAVCGEDTTNPGEVSTSPDGITWKAQAANLFQYGTHAIGARGTVN